MHLKRRTFVGALVVALAVGLGVGAFATGRARVQRPAAPLALDAPVIPVQMPLGGNSGTFAKVAEAIKPAVININTVSKGSGMQGRTPFEEFFGDEFFKRFFGDAQERIPQRSLGSGVIIDPSGIALTNAPVVEKATDIAVVTLDRN